MKIKPTYRTNNPRRGFVLSTNELCEVRMALKLRLGQEFKRRWMFKRKTHANPERCEQMTASLRADIRDMISALRKLSHDRTLSPQEKIERNRWKKRLDELFVEAEKRGLGTAEKVSWVVEQMREEPVPRSEALEVFA